MDTMTGLATSLANDDVRLSHTCTCAQRQQSADGGWAKRNWEHNLCHLTWKVENFSLPLSHSKYKSAKVFLRPSQININSSQLESIRWINSSLLSENSNKCSSIERVCSTASNCSWLSTPLSLLVMLNSAIFFEQPLAGRLRLGCFSFTGSNSLSMLPIHSIGLFIIHIKVEQVIHSSTQSHTRGLSLFILLQCTAARRKRSTNNT